MEQRIFTGGLSVIALATGLALAGCATTGSAPQQAAPVGNVVFKADFQKLAKGLTDNEEQDLQTPIDAPVVINKNGYAAKLSGKLRISTSQGLPPSGADSSWTVGDVQFSNGASPAARVTIEGVQCPFTIVAHHTPTNSSGADRKLRITFGDKEVYFAGGANGGIPGYAATVDSAKASSPCISGKTDVSLYGWNGEKGAGVRIYDIVIMQP